MNMRTLAAAAVTSLAAVAGVNAQSFTIDWKVNGVEAVSVAPGATVTVTGIASWTPAAYGLGGTQFRVNMVNADASDTLLYTEAMGLGRNPLMRFSSQTLMDSTAGSTRSITAASNAVIDAAQAPAFINPLFTQANPVEIFRFTITVGAAGREIQIGSAITGATTYANTMQPSPIAYTRISDGAMISVVPTPGSAALLGLGGLLAARRKRK